MNTLTFPLAILGFAGLTLCAGLAAYRRSLTVALPLTSVVIAVHVLLVWSHRYDWSLEQATRNGYAGFVIFHLALAVLLAANFMPAASKRVPTMLAFAVVCVGANGAVMRYPEVRGYALPVLTCTVLGLAAIVAGRRKRRRLRSIMNEP